MKVLWVRIWSSIYADWNVFSQLVPVVEDHDQVDMELNAELLVDVCRAAEDLWEQHVHGYFKIRNDVTICNLDVLNFSCWSLAFERLDTDKLDFYWLDLDLWGLTDKISIKWFIIAAIYWGNLTAEVEFWHLWFASELVRCDSEVLWHLSLSVGWIDSLTRHFAIEFRTALNGRLRCLLLVHVHRNLINDWEVDTHIWIG